MKVIFTSHTLSHSHPHIHIMPIRTICPKPRYVTDQLISGYFPRSTNVMIDPSTKKVISVNIYRPMGKTVIETHNRITISASDQRFKKLIDYAPVHPFIVFVWDVQLQMGYTRGKFRFETIDKSECVLYRLPEILSDTGDTGDTDDTDDTQNAISAALQDSPPTIGSTRARTMIQIASASGDTDVGHISLTSSTQRKRASSNIDVPIVEHGAPKRAKEHYRREVKAKPTIFRGDRMDSKLEAQVALMFTNMGINYKYSPMMFARPHTGIRYPSVKFSRNIKGATYLPDFFLPDQQLYIEVKPDHPFEDEKLRCEEMSQSGFRVVLLYGSRPWVPPFRSEETALRESGRRDYKHSRAMRGIAWINGERLAGDVSFVLGASPRIGGSLLEQGCDTNKIHLDQVCSTQDLRWNNASILDAYAASEKIEFSKEDEYEMDANDAVDEEEDELEEEDDEEDDC